MHTALALVLVLATSTAAASPPSVLRIRVVAEDLERFSLASTPSVQEANVDDAAQTQESLAPLDPVGNDPADPKPEGLLFRALGYLNYAASGAFFGSQEYRQSRTNSAWEPSPDNAMIQIGAIGASTEALNWSSSKLYREGMRAQAWALRLGQLGVFGVAAGVNFQKGWKRE